MVSSIFAAPKKNSVNYQTIKVSVHNHIATITLNRPEVFNAINGAMAGELKTAFDLCSENEDIKCIILTGEGKAFCSGQDLNEFGDQSEISILDVLNERYILW
jgi:2-(1,2-epoxy-1,2-dihydrophenyl)acetyl-CoA isomerase